MKILAVLLLLLLSLAACGTSPPARHSEGPYLVAPVIGRTAPARVGRGTVEEIMLLPGMTRIHSYPLYFGVEGFAFYAFHVLPGDIVEAGQVLAALDTQSLREQIANQELQLSRLRHTHALAERAAFNNMDRLTLQYFEAVQAATQRLDINAMESAQRLLMDRERAYLLWEQERVWQEFEMADAQLRLQELQVRLTGTELLAPFDGIITYILPWIYGNRPGGFDYILYMAPLEAEVFVEFTGENLPDPDQVVRVAGNINGQWVSLEYITLTLEEIAYFTLHNLPLPSRFSIVCGAPLPGLGKFVWIWLYTEYVQDVLRIPAGALFAQGGENYVYRMQNGVWIPTTVIAGVRTSTFIEILSGLEEGDEVLVN